MKQWMLIVVGVLVLLGLGFAGGYVFSNWLTTRAAVKVAHAEVTQADKAMAERLEQEQAAAATARQQLQQEQGKTADLNAQLAQLRLANAGLEKEISHAHFTSPATPAVAGVCPGSPWADPEYVRLYNRAAQGGLAAGPAGAPGYSSGVLAQRVRGVP
jgi:hypothetical protein